MALFVFGAFMILQENLQYFLRAWGDQIEVSAYLAADLNAADTQRLLDRVRGFAEVERARHITREQAWSDFKTALGAQSSLLDGLPRDVLPASLEISIKPAFRDTSAVETLARRLEEQKGIATVEYPQDWVERLGLIVLAVQSAKWILGGVLFLATYFIIGSAVRLAILARKEEIEIMQLVGASDKLIQAPFVIEGMIQGIAAGAISIVLLWCLFHFFGREVPAALGILGPMTAVQFLPVQSLALILMFGLLLGATGSLFSLRRFVKTW